MAKFSKLFEPGRIGALGLKNRIVMPAMGTDFAAESGEVTDTLIHWHARRAKGGAALIIVEPAQAAIAVDPLRPLHYHLRADDTRYVAGLGRLVKTIHENGAKAGIQLTPGGGAQAKGASWIRGICPQPVSPSGVPALGHTDHPRVLTTEEIEKIIELCGIAARNLRHAGFDLIEIHAHGGYLIAEFLSPYFNKRLDRYGGSLDNRCRFLLEIVGEVRKAVGPDFALAVKYSIEDSLPGGWDMKQSQMLARKLEAAGVNGIDISSGVHGAKVPAVPPYFYPRGIFIPFAEAIKKVVSIPVYGGGRLDNPRLAEKVLREGKADFICEGRALIADPDWPRKVASGQTERIRPCLACNECRQCRDTKQPVRCAVNAAAGREDEFDSIEPAEVKRKVLVVGGGPAGLEASRVAALRGHKVILCERHRQLGGLMLLGGVHNKEITAFARWMVAQIKGLPIEVRLQTEVSPALVEEIKPDAVILANGGTFVTPDVVGIDRDNVFSAQDLLKLMNGIPIRGGGLLNACLPLARRVVTATTVRRLLGSNFPIKKRVVIIGGQFPGCSLALILAKKGKKVTIIEEFDHFGKDMEAHTMVGLRDEISKGNVQVLTPRKIDEINDKGVVLIDGDKTLLEADTVIVALELAPSDSSLAEELKSRVKEVYEIGDAKSFRRIMKAISEGYDVACNL